MILCGLQPRLLVNTMQNLQRLAALKLSVGFSSMVFVFGFWFFVVSYLL